MADYSKTYETTVGYSIEDGAGLLSGFDAPSDDAPLGTMYLRTNGTPYIKISSGTGSDKWMTVKYTNLIIPFLLTDSSTHIHYVYLTVNEANQLMLGQVASVVKTSSDADTGSAHTHTVTLTFDSGTYQFNGTTSVDLFHQHQVLSAVQGDVYLRSDIKKVTTTDETLVTGYTRLKHDHVIANGKYVIIPDGAEAFLI
jgi:hypothetical protein